MINILRSALQTGRKIVESVQGLAIESSIPYSDKTSESQDGRL